MKKIKPTKGILVANLEQQNNAQFGAQRPMSESESNICTLEPSESQSKAIYIYLPWTVFSLLRTYTMKRCRKVLVKGNWKHQIRVHLFDIFGGSAMLQRKEIRQRQSERDSRVGSLGKTRGKLGKTWGSLTFPLESWLIHPDPKTMVYLNSHITG